MNFSLTCQSLVRHMYVFATAVTLAVALSYHLVR